MIGIDIKLDRNTQRRLQRKLGQTPDAIREAFAFAFEKHKSFFLGKLRSAASGRILRTKRPYKGGLAKNLKAEIVSEGRGGQLTGRFYIDGPESKYAGLLDDGGVWPRAPKGYMRIPTYDRNNPGKDITRTKAPEDSFFFQGRKKDRFYLAKRLKGGARGKSDLKIYFVFKQQAKQPDPPFKWFTSTTDEFFGVFSRNVASTMEKYFRERF